MVSAVIHERLCLFIPVPFQSLFFGTFSLQAARIMRSQAGIHPGRLFSFQGVNVCIGMAIIASYTYWAPEDRNVSCSEKNMEFYICTLDPLSIYFLIIKSHFLPLYLHPANRFISIIFLGSHTYAVILGVYFSLPREGTVFDRGLLHSKLRELVTDREAWHAAVRGIAKRWTQSD